MTIAQQATKGLLLVAAAALFGAAPAQADPIFSPDGSTASVTIQHSDLDLNSDQGQRTFRQRIRNAMGELCVRDNLTGQSVYRRCKEEIDKSVQLQIAQAGSSRLALAQRD